MTDHPERSGWVPVPDPTTLTTDAVKRSIDDLKEVLDVRFEGVAAVSDERFRKVEQQFELVERQRVEQKTDTKLAVDAALTAQKEAVASQTDAFDRAFIKSETATSKQLEQLGTTFASQLGGLGGTVEDVKERLTRIESTLVAVASTKATATNTNQWVVGLAVVAGLALLGIMVSIAIYFATQSGGSS